MTASVKPLPEATYLWEYLEYQVFTGNLYWIRCPRDGTLLKAPALAGTLIKSEGRRKITIAGTWYYMHRVILKWFTGLDPGPVIEHRHDDSLDNRVWNLIDSSHRSNACTKYALRNGELRGYRQTPSGRYRASISIDGIAHNLMTYDTKEEAHQAYLDACNELSQNPNWRPPKTNTSSIYKYVFWNKALQKWRASYWFNGKSKNVGTYENEFEAYCEALASRLEIMWIF